MSVIVDHEPIRLRVSRDGAGLLVLRLFVGFFTLYAGLQISFSAADFTEIVRALGVPLPSVAASLVVLGHVGLGVLLLVGLFTRPVGVLLAGKFLLIFFTYYVLQFDSTLMLTPVGTLWGVESLSYGAAGIFFACTGAGRYSLDALLGPVVRRRTNLSPRFLRYLLADTELSQAARGDLHAAAVGQVFFRLFIGSLLLLHSISQIIGRSLDPGTETMAKLANKLMTLGLPLPTVMAWVTTLAMLAVGMLLLLGVFTRAGGILLAVVATVLLLAVPELGGTTVEGYGFHGEELFFLAAVGVFFALTGSGRFSLNSRQRRDAESPAA